MHVALSNLNKELEVIRCEKKVSRTASTRTPEGVHLYCMLHHDVRIVMLNSAQLAE